MKRILSLLLSIIMLFVLAGCGVQFMKPLEEDKDQIISEQSNGYDGDALFAFVSTASGIDDGGLNQRVHTVTRQFCDTFCVPYSYYILPDDNSPTINDILEGVVDDGYSVVVLPGASFSDALLQTAMNHPEVIFVGVDISEKDLNDRYRVPKNVCCLSFSEEISGFLAGYASVAFGYTHLGFLGGKPEPAIKRYGVGFIQGANLASIESDQPVTIEYVYAGTDTYDVNVTQFLDNWYGETGVQLVFAAGGDMARAAAAVAAKHDGKVIGADFDRSSEINEYGADICVSSAEKGYRNALRTVLLDAMSDEKWEAHSGKTEVYGLISSEDVQSNFAQLSYSNTAWTENFGTVQYAELIQRILKGEIIVSKKVDILPDISITLNNYDNIK